MSAEGILPVRKPKGYTSHDIVAMARRWFRMKRIGHTGTLDPQVTGVLPLCLGRATRLVETMQDVPKEYVARFLIGFTTDTEDLEGTVTHRQARPIISEEKLADAIASFQGVIWQQPPMYSAVKVDGKRLYELARAGRVVERAKRQVHIYEMELQAFSDSGEYPEATIRVRCSKGTYIRTLCKDIGLMLGYPAVMSELVRTSTAHIGLDQCSSLDDIQRMCDVGRINDLLLPMDYALKHLPAVVLTESLAQKALSGQHVHLDAAPTVTGDWPDFPPNPYVRAYAAKSGIFLGLYTYLVDEQRLVPHKVFLP